MIRHLGSPSHHTALGAVVPWKLPSTVTRLNRISNATNLQVLEYKVRPGGSQGQGKISCVDRGLEVCACVMVDGS